MSLKARQPSVDGWTTGRPALKMEPWHSLSLRRWRLPVAAFLTGRHGSCAFPMRFVTSNNDGRSPKRVHTRPPLSAGRTVKSDAGDEQDDDEQRAKTHAILLAALAGLTGRGGRASRLPS